MAWSVNDTVSETVFMSLVDAEQIDITYNFLDAASLTMDKLQFYNKLASGDVNQASAQMLAAKLDNQFTQLYLANYQTGKSQHDSLVTMLSVLINAEKTVEDLANTVSSCYKFS